MPSGGCRNLEHILSKDVGRAGSGCVNRTVRVCKGATVLVMCTGVSRAAEGATVLVMCTGVKWC